jgi:hypothetical protein
MPASFTVRTPEELPVYRCQQVLRYELRRSCLSIDASKFYGTNSVGVACAWLDAMMRVSRRGNSGVRSHGATSFPWTGHSDGVSVTRRSLVRFEHRGFVRLNIVDLFSSRTGRAPVFDSNKPGLGMSSRTRDGNPKFDTNPRSG